MTEPHPGRPETWTFPGPPDFSCAWPDLLPAPDLDPETAAGAEADAFDDGDRLGSAQEAEAEWADEWDCADSNAYQARVEAGLEPEAGG